MQASLGLPTIMDLLASHRTALAAIKPQCQRMRRGPRSIQLGIQHVGDRGTFLSTSETLSAAIRKQPESTQNRRRIYVILLEHENLFQTPGTALNLS